MANLKLRSIFFLIVSLFTLAGCGSGGSSQEAVSNPTNPPAPPTTSSPTISSIQIIDTETDTTVQSVNQDTTIDLEALPDNFNFVAIPGDETAVESVAFVLSGCASIERTEIEPPYSLQDELVGLSSLPEGECSITATPYSEDNLQGDEGPAFTVAFEVVGDTGTEVNSPPTIQLIGSSTVSVPNGGSYNELGATATDFEDGDLTSNIEIQGGNINTFIAGTYLITYLIADSVGAMASVERSVIVENEQLPQPPEITLNGSNAIFIEVNENFTDPGATAFDQEDGDLTNSIEILSNNVDTSSVGEYEIVYRVEDLSGLTDQVRREVTVVPSGSSSGDIDADIVSLSRVNGVSPETVYFNADESTCSDCTDLFGLNTAEADAYSVLSYHFNFDDSDSGTFDTTGNSRNVQISGSPRAAHTFHCFGPGDPNWDSNDQRCEFDVGVRVQALDNDYDDAFVRVNIQPAVGVGGYYADSDVICVSSTSDFTDCLELAPGANTSTDVPSVGNWDGRLAIIDNNGGTYSDVCMGADEQNGAAIAYGPNLVSGAAVGSRPRTGTSILSSRPGVCVHTFFSDSFLVGLEDNWPERNGAGELVDGWGFGQKVVGMAIGRVRVGPTGNLIQYHDITAGLAGGGSGEISMLSAAGFCRDSELTCSLIPSASFIFLTDSSSDGNPNDLPIAANIGCFNRCDLTNAVIMGTRANRSSQHNLRLMGAWGLILSNNWMQGDHVGGSGPKAQVTVRHANDGASLITDLNRNPEDLTTLSNYTRASSDSGDFMNRYLVSVDNLVNQASHEANHDGGVMHMIAGIFTIEDGTFYFADSASAGTPKIWMEGVYKVVRNFDVQTPSTTDCGFRTDRYSDNSAVNQSNTFYYEGTPDCSGGGAITTRITPLPTPAAPGN